jgi:hypothetical protein
VSTRHGLAALAAAALAAGGWTRDRTHASRDGVAITVERTDPRLRRDGSVLRLGDAPLTGVVVRRYPGGRPAESRAYRDGVEDGAHRGWWESGAPRFALTYRRGVLEGAAREWYAAGGLYREMHYAAGHEAGSQRVWWPDGRVRASYVVRDGRRYGLMGAKGCVTEDGTKAAPAR